MSRNKSGLGMLLVLGLLAMGAGGKQFTPGKVTGEREPDPVLGGVRQATAMPAPMGEFYSMVPDSFEAALVKQGLATPDQARRAAEVYSLYTGAGAGWVTQGSLPGPLGTAATLAAPRQLVAMEPWEPIRSAYDDNRATEAAKALYGWTP